jgi:hypothetical protein
VTKLCTLGGGEGGERNVSVFLGAVSFPDTWKNFSTFVFSEINELRKGIRRRIEK